MGKRNHYIQSVVCIKQNSVKTRKHCCGKVISYQCFVMFPSVGKVVNISMRNISSHGSYITHYITKYYLHMPIRENNVSRARKDMETKLALPKYF